jgi:hypothetical protein
MSTRFRFHIGPFYFSQRLGRTQAQRRAAAKARADRKPWRSIVSLNGVVTARTPGQAEVAILGRDSHDGPINMIGQTVTIPCKDPAVTEGQGVHLHYRRGDSKLRGLTVDPAIAAQEAERLTAKADHDARTYRAVITECPHRRREGRRVHHRGRGPTLRGHHRRAGYRAALPLAEETATSCR